MTKHRKFSILSAASTIKSTVADVAKLRWLIFTITHLALLAVVSVGASLSLTIVAMIESENNNSTLPEANNTEIIIVPINTSNLMFQNNIHVPWSGTDKDRMLQAFFWGGLATSIVGGRAAEIYGPRLVIALSLLSTGVLNLLYPTVALNSFIGAYIIRVIQGISVGVVLPASFVVVTRWSTNYEKTLANAFVGSGNMIANIIAHPVSGILVGGNFLGGWPAVFYIFGAFNIIMVIPLWFLVYDNPENHPYLSHDELEEILSRRALKSSVKTSVPWIKMLTSLGVWGYLIIPITYGWYVGVISTQIPSFYEEVLHLGHEANGFMNSLPWILSLISIPASFLADKVCKARKISVANVRKIFTFIGLGSASIFIFLVTFIGIENKLAVVALISLGKGLGAINVAGSDSNHLDLTPTFSGTLSGFNSMFQSLSALAANEGAARILGDSPTPDKWYYFFALTACINLFGLLFFCIVGKGDIQSWDPSCTKKSNPKSTKADKIENNTRTFSIISLSQIKEEDEIRAQP